MNKSRKSPKKDNIEPDTPPRPLSKHERRTLRRCQYFKMIDDELPLEHQFKGRVIDSLNHDGWDIGPDGKPIKSAWWGYIESRQNKNRNSAEACGYLVRGAITGIRPAVT